MKKDIAVQTVHAFDMCRLVWKEDSTHETYRLGEGFFPLGENTGLTIGNKSFVGPTIVHAEIVDRLHNGKFVWLIIHGEDVDYSSVEEIKEKFNDYNKIW